MKRELPPPRGLPTGRARRLGRAAVRSVHHALLFLRCRHPIGRPAAPALPLLMH